MANELTRENAVYILNTIFGEILVSVNIFRTHLTRIDPKTVAIHKDDIHLRLNILLSQVTISCTKYIEFCRKYSKLLNELVPELNDDRNRLQEEIQNRHMIAYRNDVVGHIHSKQLKRPLTLEEYQERFDQITGGMDNMNQFLEWLCPSDFKNIDKLYSVCREIKKFQEALFKLKN
jgi:hypothetical protein